MDSNQSENPNELGNSKLINNKPKGMPQSNINNAEVKLSFNEQVLKELKSINMNISSTSASPWSPCPKRRKPRTNSSRAASPGCGSTAN